MKILVAHNYYQQPGGEDTVVKFELELLRRHGHEVLFVEFSNKDFNELNPAAKVSNVLSWDFSKRSYEIIHQHCLNFRPDIAHFHNTFYMMTPSVYAACHEAGVPVVQSLHNFRLLCSNAVFYRDGHTCEECLDFTLSRGIRYGCYHDSKVLTWAVVRMLEANRRNGQWINQVDAFIASTDFCRQKFEQGGIPKEKIWVKGHFIPQDPGLRNQIKDYFVFAGRLSEEKGVKVLLEAFKDLRNVKLIIMGDGPLKGFAEDFIRKHGLNHIRMAGFLQRQEYYDTLKGAQAVIFPSVCYETFGMTIVDAFACGIPVIASDHGSMPELVQDGKTGLLFEPGDAGALKEKIQSLVQNPQQIPVLGAQARKYYETNLSVESNYRQLMSIYAAVSRPSTSPRTAQK
jgi:glycosyltransferase involved in cell wall biosynthesis